MSRATTVLGQPVAATKPRHGVKPFGWTVLLYGVPDAATRKDIVAGLVPGIRPVQVDVGEKMSEADVNEAVDGLKVKAMDFGPLKKWHHAPSAPTSRRTRVGATFEHPASAEEAAKALHGQRLEFKDGTHAQLAAEVYTTIQISIPASQYRATKAPIEEAVAPWEQKRISFMARLKQEKYVSLYLSSYESYYPALLDATKAVEDVLDGHLVISEDDKPLWHPAFERNWPWFDKVKDLEDELPVYIVRSRTNTELRVSGPWHECRLAMKRIAAIAAEAGSGEEPPAYDKAAPFY